MRIYLAGIILTGLLSAGCSSDWDPARNGASDAVARGGEQAISLPTATLAARGAAIGVASLPDRGELLSYSNDREIRRSGAYTSHPVEISEAHALNAIAAGGLRLSTPDGRPVNVSFDRIEESSDGNWTWIGESESGDHAVLTFGERAVFGEIFADGQAFRVTTRGGTAWVVETNQALLAGNRPGHHGDGPEFLIPPSAVASDTDMAGAGVMSAASSAVIPKASPAVIDLVLGYTNGMVSTYGSQGAAVTRLTNLVALGNAALQRSGVNMRVRLVHALQVSFADNTDNSDALQRLTGYNATTRQRTTPDSAFNALRQAREEYGADLVSLVRPHRSPEQRGCGIAWLIGASGATIVPAQDEYFGYSVVSDGADVDENDGHTYFCSDYSLIHEIGHNLGQAHNRTDSEYAGAHPYSYGYRETSSSGFHTIMAYPIANSSQTEIAYFATPLINFAAGRPMGTAGTSDNVRSMNETMPFISDFRATKVPLAQPSPSDFNGDGRSDVLWRHRTNGENIVWRSANRDTGRQVLPVVNAGFKVAGTGDFNGDGASDILWRHSTTGQNIVWLSANRTTGRRELPDVNANFIVAGIGDFNGDGRSDILWRNTRTGENIVWFSGDRANRRVLPEVATTFHVAGIGDFDGDGRADILWRHTTNGQNVIWRAGDRDVGRLTLPVVAVDYVVAGIGDFDGDGKSDILWRHRTNGSNVMWKAADRTNGRVALPAVASQFIVAQVGDFDGDGKSDILWRNTVNGDNVIWKAANRSTGRQALPRVAVEFEVASR